MSGRAHPAHEELVLRDIADDGTPATILWEFFDVMILWLVVAKERVSVRVPHELGLVKLKPHFLWLAVTINLHPWPTCG
jgi:hypothetical protein